MSSVRLLSRSKEESEEVRLARGTLMPALAMFVVMIDTTIHERRARGPDPRPPHERRRGLVRFDALYLRDGDHDDHGRQDRRYPGGRRTFRQGLIVFAGGALMSALTPDLGVLILGWSVLEGLGAALVMPSTEKDGEGDARHRVQPGSSIKYLRSGLLNHEVQ